MFSFSLTNDVEVPHNMVVLQYQQLLNNLEGCSEDSLSRIGILTLALVIHYHPLW